MRQKFSCALRDLKLKKTSSCYGPMITPEVESGHTISRPVAVMGAEVGDGVALRIKTIKITSKASASGTETPREGSFVGDPGGGFGR